ncbi:sodium-dependent transporter [Photobacterium leiognathi]|uniref:sodium-dependent transporter n=1 Tax=Photobacterium leiognathi TaxID=553611 RepID=UPI000208890F|nr:sodium-dependent transporter [Photobacterium leiognathi]MCG3886164.1 sodium-dependent transporter [Photobacterium leiognathi]PSV01922.1 sodium-dependent transporter [Photobacterium leiognathi subsp. mandapamensis]PSW52505.1 sodium-dependent transporter [Photobacterium leiognathi subsp. mandapamensis]PSW67482.1 sodium-dependent transporter [Photobacterium leiognathi subsp. mandapamensis]GAA06673.1 sodium:neurotransmitter symporter family protein [Photobacterium leiognathi subsp. mandapamensi
MDVNSSTSPSRGNWSSKIGFVMAAAGSAVGLGNIWKFPYTAGENGGGAFVAIYLLFVIFIGFSVMLTEFAVGRKTGLSAVGAFKTTDRRWTFVGIMGVLSGLLIMGFYPVVGGWAIAYIYKISTGLLSQPTAIGDSFSGFIADPMQPLFWMGLYLLLNIFVVIRGVSGGIEKAGKILMPLLFIILIIVSVKGLTLPGAMAGLEFLFKPDFSKIDSSVVLAALGQAFFSLSLGMGCMLTYGSYLRKKENLVQTTAMVTAMDTGVALLAGIAMFPAMFAFSMEPSAGPGLVFVVVPQLFAEMGGIGFILALLFFIGLSVAALTSSVSLLEVVVAYLIDEKGFSRVTAVISASIVMALLCILASLSIGGLGPKLFDTGAFDIFDLLTDKIFLAVGGMLVCLFAGWRLDRSELKKEITNDGKVSFPLFNLWYALIKYIIPVAIAIVAISGVKAGFDSDKGDIMLLGLAIIALCGVFSKKL